MSPLLDNWFPFSVNDKRSKSSRILSASGVGGGSSPIPETFTA